MRVVTRIDIGKIGETIAAQYLISAGYEVLSKNVRFGRNELDLLTYQDGVYVLVEVKYVQNGRNIHPEEMYTYRKNQNFKRTVLKYLDSTEGVNRHTWRADLICVERGPGNRCKIRHYKNVLY